MKLEIPKSEDTSSVFHPDVKAEDEKPQDIVVKTELDNKPVLIKDETKEPVKPEMDVEHCDVDVKVPITDSKCKSEVKEEMEVKEEKKPLLLGSETCGLVSNHSDREASMPKDSSETRSASHTDATPLLDVRLTSPPAERVSPAPMAQTPAVTGTTVTHVAIVKAEPMEIDLDLERNSTEPPRPEKRRRVFMDAVIVPSRALVTARAEAERQSIHRQLEQLHNPLVKKPKNAPTLSLDTIRLRLQPIGYEPYPIDLDKTTLDVTVRRDFMSKEYGGSEQETYPKIGAAFVAKTGMKHFTYLHMLCNPHCPEVPGAPGLLFDAICPDDSDLDTSDDDDDDDNEDDEEEKDRSDSEDEKSRTLFSRLDSAVWQYQGQYVTAPAAPLTLNEWKQQSPQVRKNWAKELSVKGWGRQIRADIVLRQQLGRKPTKAEKRTALATENKFNTVTPEEITSAFDRGEVIIVVSTMKCVGYNVDFQRDLAA
ncbi:hypothetical protein C8R44DRAFT_705091 [Mycena epipterygia]|nr:hypothetical protein C8R44DRAFT_705091 [Mycena epipterygia]